MAMIRVTDLLIQTFTDEDRDIVRRIWQMREQVEAT